MGGLQRLCGLPVTVLLFLLNFCQPLNTDTDTTLLLEINKLFDQLVNALLKL